MEGLDLGQTSNPSLAWKKGRFQINDDDDDDDLPSFYVPARTLCPWILISWFNIGDMEQVVC